MDKRARILVVDDEPIFRNLIVSLLCRDFFVSVASDGSEGFRKALEHPPDVAIIDICMPGWDGLKTLQAFRSHPALNAVKIAILTGDASKETVLSAIRGGANDYIIKSSFSRLELLEKLDKLLAAPPSHVVGQANATARPAPAGAKSTIDGRCNASSYPTQMPVRRAAAVGEVAGDSAFEEIIDHWE